MTFLIDAYNLMHAVGLAHRHMPTGELQRARRRLIEWLATAPANRSGLAQFRVVFDAQNGRPGSSEQSQQGVVVHYAIGETADDAIEDRLLIEADAPHWVVISNDMRLHESARRRGSESWTCQKFVDWLIDENAQTGVVPQSLEKPDDPMTADELAELAELFDRPLNPPPRKNPFRRR